MDASTIFAVAAAAAVATISLAAYYTRAWCIYRKLAQDGTLSLARVASGARAIAYLASRQVSGGLPPPLPLVCFPLSDELCNIVSEELGLPLPTMLSVSAVLPMQKRYHKKKGRNARWHKLTLRRRGRPLTAAPLHDPVGTPVALHDANIQVSGSPNHSLMSPTIQQEPQYARTTAVPVESEKVVALALATIVEIQFFIGLYTGVGEAVVGSGGVSPFLFLPRGLLPSLVFASLQALAAVFSNPNACVRELSVSNLSARAMLHGLRNGPQTARRHLLDLAVCVAAVRAALVVAGIDDDWVRGDAIYALLGHSTAFELLGSIGALPASIADHAPADCSPSALCACLGSLHPSAAFLHLARSPGSLFVASQIIAIVGAAAARAALGRLALADATAAAAAVAAGSRAALQQHRVVPSPRVVVPVVPSTSAPVRGGGAMTRALLTLKSMRVINPMVGGAKTAAADASGAVRGGGGGGAAARDKTKVSGTLPALSGAAACGGASLGIAVATSEQTPSRLLAPLDVIDRLAAAADVGCFADGDIPSAAGVKPSQRRRSSRASGALHEQGAVPSMLAAVTWAAAKALTLDHALAVLRALCCCMQWCGGCCAAGRGYGTPIHQRVGVAALPVPVQKRGRLRDHLRQGARVEAAVEAALGLQAAGASPHALLAAARGAGAAGSSGCRTPIRSMRLDLAGGIGGADHSVAGGRGGAAEGPCRTPGCCGLCRVCCPTDLHRRTALAAAVLSFCHRVPGRGRTVALASDSGSGSTEEEGECGVSGIADSPDAEPAFGRVGNAASEGGGQTGLGLLRRGGAHDPRSKIRRAMQIQQQMQMHGVVSVAEQGGTESSPSQQQQQFSSSCHSLLDGTYVGADRVPVGDDGSAASVDAVEADAPAIVLAAPAVAPQPAAGSPDSVRTGLQPMQPRSRQQQRSAPSSAEVATSDSPVAAAVSGDSPVPEAPRVLSPPRVASGSSSSSRPSPVRALPAPPPLAVAITNTLSRPDEW